MIKQIALLLGLGSGIIFAQQNSITLSANTPAPINFISVQNLTGTPASTTQCFYVVAIYPIGESQPFGPTCIFNAVQSGTIRITWNGINGATGYHLLQSPSQANPLASGSCNNCRLVTNTPNLTFTWNLSAGGSYTPNPAKAATCVTFLDNLDYAVPTVVNQCLWRFQQGIQFADGSTQTTAPTNIPGVGTVTSVAVGNLTDLFNTTVTNPTTTPSVTFAKPNFAAHNFYGNNTGAPAAPTQVQPAFTDISGTINTTTQITAGSISNTNLTNNSTTVNGQSCVLGGSCTVTSNPTNSHSISTVLVCPTSSASGTAETCSTTPSFTPVAGDPIIFQADIANTGAFTLDVNGLGAKSVVKNGNLALVANDIKASPFQLLMIYDGTNWEIQGQIGNAAAGATTNQNLRTVGVTFDGGGSALSGTTTRCTQVNFAGTINEYTLVADQTGNATVTVEAVLFSAYTGPGSAVDISNGGEAMAGAVKLQDTTLTGWTTALAANTVVCFVLSSPATVTWASANIRVVAN